MACDLEQTNELAKAVIRDYVQTIAKTVTGKIENTEVYGSVDEVNFFDKATRDSDLSLAPLSIINVDDLERSKAVEIVVRKYNSAKNRNWEDDEIAEKVYEKLNSELSGVANRGDTSGWTADRCGYFVFLSEKDWIGMAADIMGTNRRGVVAAMEQFEHEKSTDVSKQYRY